METAALHLFSGNASQNRIDHTMKQEETLPKYLHYANLLHKAKA